MEIREVFNLNKSVVKVISVFFVLFIFCTTLLSAAVGAEEATVKDAAEITAKSEASPKEDTKTESEKSEYELVVSSEHLSVTVLRTVQLKATVKGVTIQPNFKWTSSDEKVATVDESGKVRGRKAGRVIITARAVVDGEKLEGKYALNVVTSTNFIKDFLEEKQVLSYQYSYIDDYYYTNDKEAWQYNFGYGPLYDIAAPFVLLEYDYVRVFFEYQDKDWMIQLWKGQYGLLFYGCEVGIYNKAHSDKEDNIFTFYKCPPEEDWIKMELTMYHENLKGEYVREFTRPYDTYWWCTGFKDGHLRIEEPANELRMYTRLTLKDKEMTKLFTQGLRDCGFEQTKNFNKLDIEQFYVDGTDVYIKWQEINEAENTMPIKIGFGFMTVANIVTVLLAIISFFAMIAGSLMLIFFFI